MSQKVALKKLQLRVENLERKVQKARELNERLKMLKNLIERSTVIK